MEKKKQVKFCTTVVQTFSEANKQEAFDQFVENLKQLGAESDNIKELANTNRTFWQETSETGHAMVAVEIVRYSFEST